jgi:signal transduction histidine kinase
MKEKMSEIIRKIIDTNDFLASLFNNLDSAIFIVDENIRVQNVNKTFETLFHKSEDEVYNELCGNAIGCIFPVQAKTNCGETVNCKICQLRKNLIRCLEEKAGPLSTIIEREFFINNEKVLKYFHATMKYFEYNDLKLVLVMIFEITELETQRKHLKELNDLKNEFLGMAAHDLRNPIATIMGASSLLLNYTNKIKDEEKFKLLDMIQRSSDFMLNLVNDLLDISTIEAGKLELEKTENNYIEFVEDNLSLNRIIAKEKDITIETEYAENIPQLQFDKTKITQVLNNLISNAIKFSNDAAKITVKIERDQNFVITKVIDQGPGIPGSDLAKIFTEFQKASVKAPKGERSTGLGLAIAKKIVEKHDGKIGVKSKVGKGSTFYFSLPISDFKLNLKSEKSATELISEGRVQ